MRHEVLFCAAVFSTLVFGCAPEPNWFPKRPPRPAPIEITLAGTTSLHDSGLLDELLPEVERAIGVRVKAISVGSGQALAMGRRGDVDVLIAHSPKDEEAFVAEGYGVARRPLMHNDFVVIGPESDPAGVREAKDAVQALAAIAKKQATFVSRADDSGTHKKELSLWKDAELEVEGAAWHVKAGVGMGATLRIAEERQAYALTDRGTWLTMRENLTLRVVHEGDSRLINRYSVIVINPEKHPHTQVDAATRFADYLLSPEGQATIGKFGVDRFGQSLFTPDAPSQAD